MSLVVARQKLSRKHQVYKLFLFLSCKAIFWCHFHVPHVETTAVGDALYWLR